MSKFKGCTQFNFKRSWFFIDDFICYVFLCKEILKCTVINEFKTSCFIYTNRIQMKLLKLEHTLTVHFQCWVHVRCQLSRLSCLFDQRFTRCSIRDKKWQVLGEWNIFHGMRRNRTREKKRNVDGFDVEVWERLVRNWAMLRKNVNTLEARSIFTSRNHGTGQDAWHFFHFRARILTPDGKLMITTKELPERRVLVIFFLSSWCHDMGSEWTQE